MLELRHNNKTGGRHGHERAIQFVFETMCPWIKIVYDPFNVIRHYNDNVLTEI